MTNLLITDEMTSDEKYEAIFHHFIDRFKELGFNEDDASYKACLAYDKYATYDDSDAETFIDEYIKEEKVI